MADADQIDAVKNSEYALLNAQVRADKKVLEEIISDDFVGINPDGSRVSKQEEINNLTSTSYSSGEIEDLVINIHGNTAIATGQIVLGAEVASHRFSFTDVYVDQKLVSSQAALLA